MGYYEVPCQLCWVSFKIGRLRTQFEPREAAWSSNTYESAIPDEDYEPCTQRECKTVTRRGSVTAGSTTQYSGKPIPEEFEDMIPCGIDLDGHEVSFQVYMSLQVNDEPGTTDRSIVGNRRKDDWENHGQAYWAWYESRNPNDRKNSNREDVRDDDAHFVEHIASVGCEHICGYNGNNISAEEMRACTTLQCIVQKVGKCRDPFLNWSPAPDDEDFERESNYFLSGLGDRCGSWEDDTTVYPKRHGFDDINPMQYNGFELGDLPFHPYCLEMYKRVSQLRAGKVDIVALADWWGMDGNDTEIPEHPAVGRGSDQSWQYCAGDEWIMAHPLQIPALTSLLEAAGRPLESFNARSSPFGTAAKEVSNSTDSFGKLPAELRDIVVASLGSRDIANLRLASRTFRHLPITLWHDLMQKEMPWIWEAWTHRPYAFMSCVTRKDLEAHDEAVQVRMRAAQELGSEQKAVQEDIIAREDAEFRKPRDVRQLDRLRTDWYFLYCQIRREGRKLKGLRNRERIWKSIEYIVRRVTNPNEDIDAARKDHEEAFPH